MNSQNSKRDTPIKKSTSSSHSNQHQPKEPILSDIWNLLTFIQSKVSSHDSHLKNINSKLLHLENNYSSMKALIDDFRLELFQLKTDQHALESELSSIQQKVVKFENTQTSSQFLDFNNIYNEFHDRITREQNILIFMYLILLMKYLLILN
jgi:chromosome segregation ATPase